MEISRFSDTKDWFHITTEKNVGTRPALVAKIGPGSKHCHVYERNWGKILNEGKSWDHCEIYS
jgi:hypothetical protein